MLTVTKLWYSLFGVCLSDVHWSVSILFLRVTVHWLFISLLSSETGCIIKIYLVVSYFHVDLGESLQWRFCDLKTLTVQIDIYLLLDQIYLINLCFRVICEVLVHNFTFLYWYLIFRITNLFLRENFSLFTILVWLAVYVEFMISFLWAFMFSPIKWMSCVKMCRTIALDWKILFTNASARAGYDTRSIFKRSFNRFEFRVFLLLD